MRLEKVEVFKSQPILLIEENDGKEEKKEK